MFKKCINRRDIRPILTQMSHFILKQQYFSDTRLHFLAKEGNMWQKSEYSGKILSNKSPKKFQI